MTGIVCVLCWEGGGGTSVRVRLAVKLNQYIQQSLLKCLMKGLISVHFPLARTKNCILGAFFGLLSVLRKH